MTELARPAARPARPHFSSGPCAKRPGWSIEALKNALVGRSHRSKPGKARLQKAIDKTREVGIVPASDTGAVEMAMWSMLGERGVDMVAFESFGEGWVTDAVKQLKLADARVIKAPYGQLPDLSTIDTDRDVVFTWNGTTSGVKIPNGDWIKADRKGLTICDATSAAFAQDLPWAKLDVVTFSWQKVLGGEAAHGMLILSPRAAERLVTFSPPRPLPKIFRMTSGGKLIEGLFKGETINTPSMVCVEDYLDALAWAESVGGLDGLMKRADQNLAVIADFVGKSKWAAFLAEDAAICSNTSVCLKIVDPRVTALSAEAQAMIPKRIEALLDAEGVANDINGYRDAPPGLRIWAGATIERSDLDALFPWLDWAFETTLAELAKS